MDLGGRVSGYRGVAIRCPGCGDPMVQEQVGDAEVDLCPACGGIWLDWFDGETSALAVGVLEKEKHRPSAPARSPAPSNEPRATGACPRCTRQLASQRYVATFVQDGKRHEHATSADLLRCEECVGVFVSRSSAETIVAVANADGPRSLPPSDVKPALWDRLLAVLSRIFGR